MEDPSSSTSTTFSAERFFETQEPPPKLAHLLEGVKTFVTRHALEGRRVVLVTSGGTTVPLEHNVVRFLDNFSAGTRGAASAEQFLRTGKYAVIFLHRQHSLQPFSRHYSHSTNPFLDLLEHTSEEIPEEEEPRPEIIQRVEEVFEKQAESADVPVPEIPKLPTDSEAAGSETHIFPNLHALGLNRESRKDQAVDGRVQVRLSESNAMQAILGSYKLVQKLGLLHSIPFVTVFDYLFLLRGIAQIMGAKETGLGRRGLYYLAAAVSDFFLPQQRMSQHKIQSGKGSLVIEMDQVPKVLRTLVEHWSQDGMIVSFKLETDRNLIIPKARQALDRYGHQVVIGNDLATRKHEVVFVQKDSEDWVRITDEQVAAGVEIEEAIIDRLIKMHDAYIEEGRKAQESS
ncbi:DNA/pantothenate metabolism flavoprotein [Cystobasidium minutum MCA 4210]|uniref:DNA/pantothenate metabolism flavoprotein n=1 Tax=Cystobasidium minutum MCA 4210 TaxID=1397322 RepID=UPI0034CD370C|eukprot:jgi/Rhomi1/18246/CE18245_3664